MPCTDFSVSQDMSAGQASSIINLPPNILIALQFTGGDWVALGNGGGQWAVTTQIRYCFFLSKTEFVYEKILLFNHVVHMRVEMEHIILHQLRLWFL